MGLTDEVTLPLFKLLFIPTWTVAEIIYFVKEWLKMNHANYRGFLSSLREPCSHLGAHLYPYSYVVNRPLTNSNYQSKIWLSTGPAPSSAHPMKILLRNANRTGDKSVCFCYFKGSLSKCKKDFCPFQEKVRGTVPWICGLRTRPPPKGEAQWQSPTAEGVPCCTHFPTENTPGLPSAQ